MAMYAPGEGSPRERQRLRKLAQAAMNADQTVDQMESILSEIGPVLAGMSGTMGDLDNTIVKLEASLDHLGTSLNSVDETVARMGAVVGRLELVVDRVESLVGVAELALRPLGALESAGREVSRGVIGFLGFGGSHS